MGSPRSGVFATIPDSFFSPLASPLREHYASLLVIFFRLFQEQAGGIERSAVTARFTEYFALDPSRLSGIEDDEIGQDDDDSGEPLISVASRFLRRLINAGWMAEEVLSDYTRIVNITPYARPFFEALAKVEEGLRTEYESHVVAVYSLLCGDAALENGHFAVLNAHNATMALIDSLKVLSQSIKGHYDRFLESASLGIKELLHLHYDLYADDILDGAYKRLKTSDNLSRYRPRIVRQVGTFLSDTGWLDESSRKLSRTGSGSIEEARVRLEVMLTEIRDTLKAVDPLLEDIDRRNMLYARASVERVKLLLEPDSTVTGKIMELARAIIGGNRVYTRLAHHLHRVRAITPESRYIRWLRDTVNLSYAPLAHSSAAELERAEAELRLRLEKQLGPKKICLWLDGEGGMERPLWSSDLVKDADSFVRLLYAVVYADSRVGRFLYTLEEGPSERILKAGFDFPDLSFRRKR